MKKYSKLDVANKVKLHPDYRPIPPRPKGVGQPKHQDDSNEKWEEETAYDRAINNRLYHDLKDEILAELEKDE
tara:strand:- start:347 stop:565 length:219 start_codon:yes stop_codon:yes gene_type:complete